MDASGYVERDGSVLFVFVQDHAPIPSTGLFESKLGKPHTLYRIPIKLPKNEGDFNQTQTIKFMSDETPSVPPPVTNAAVETFGLTRHYGNLTALSSLDLTINKGDLFGFIGSNGAGKTTTLRILSTFLAPSNGTARVMGHNVVKEADQVRRILGYMPDFFGVYKDMEVTEYLDFFVCLLSHRCCPAPADD